MNCKQFHKNIVPFLNKDLNSNASQSFSEHIAICSNCKNLLNEVSMTMSLNINEEVSLEDPYFFQRLRAVIENRREKNITLLSKKLRPIIAFAFLTFALSAGIFIGNKYIQVKYLSEYTVNTIGASDYNNDYIDFFNLTEIESGSPEDIMLNDIKTTE